MSQEEHLEIITDTAEAPEMPETPETPVEVPPIVIDNGSDTIKAGFGGNDLPYVLIANISGAASVMKEDIETKNRLTLKYPIKHGVVTNWDDMENIWYHTFKTELGVAPEDCSTLLTEFGTKEDNLEMMQIMFETFNTPAIYLCQQSVLSLYASGRTTGIVLDIGGDVAQAVPIYEGYALARATSRLTVCGNDLTDYIMKIMSERGYCSLMKSAGGRETARDIKEKICYVSLDFKREIYDIKGKYKLPDGKYVTIGNEQFACGESLFKPLINGKYGDGIHKTTYESIMKCDGDIRIKLCESIVLSGGSTMMNGLKHRFTNEIKTLLPSNIKKNVRVIASPERQIGAFIGGSILSSISYFDGWTSRDEYDEGLYHRQLKQNPTSVRYSVCGDDKNDKNDNMTHDQFIAAKKDKQII